MNLRETLEIVGQHRGQQIVMTTMSSVGVWPGISDTPRDFHYLPSSMGQAVPLALGLALAKPGLGVIVLNGDGGTLMNLGCLVTLAQHRVPVHMVLLDNGLYEVTGGQPVPGAGRTDFGLLARGAGIPEVKSCATIEEWRQVAPTLFSLPHPTLAWLKIVGEYGKATPSAPRPMAEQIQRLQTAIA